MQTHPLTKAVRSALDAFSRLDPGSDAELLEQFVARHDEAAFTILVHRYAPMVFRVCRRVLANSDDADDAFQTTFVVLARRAAVIVKRPSLASWLHSVTVRVALNARRSAQLRRAREQPMATTGVDLPDPKEAVVCDLRPTLDEELGRLPERYRAPIVLCYLEGRSVDEAAAALGCPRGTVATRMSRGRDLLRNRLTRRGVTL